MEPQRDEVAALFARMRQAWKPPAHLSLSQWAELKFRLSAESAAEPGRWHTLPYQRGILDAITDHRVERVSVMKSARIGYTLMLSATIGYFIDQEPSSMMVVQPTLGDAKGFSKETIGPMMRDVPALAEIAFTESEEKGQKDSSATLTHKSFPGGVLSITGANSGTGLRRISRRVVLLDEVDAYPPSAGHEGDPIKLAEKRAEYFWDRKIIAGSTPLVAGVSRIEEMFEAGDQRRYYVPCPHCKHMDYLRFNVQRDDEELDAGHLMKWDKGKPETAYFMCRECGCVIDESHKRAMLEGGEWRADREFKGHASFHIWAAYSLSPNATWAHIAIEVVEAKGNPLKLQTFVNTTLGETWKEKGEAPDWERLYERRELYPIGSVPEGARWLTCGVDVQKDRFVYEVVGWAANKESWSIEKGMLFGDTALEETWKQLDVLRARTFPSSSGELPIALLAIDSGYNTQMTYTWARQYVMSSVIACKGVSGMRMLISTPSSVDVTIQGKKLKRGYKVWPIGVDIAKSELYAWLPMRRKPNMPTPAGYCHFPEYDEEFFQQLTAEHLVPVVNKVTRRRTLQWHVQPNRENHFLDTRILARVAMALLGIDRLPADERGAAGTPAKAAAKTKELDPGVTAPAVTTAPLTPDAPPARGGFWKKRGEREASSGSSWFKRRR